MLGECYRPLLLAAGLTVAVEDPAVSPGAFTFRSLRRGSLDDEASIFPGDVSLKPLATSTVTHGVDLLHVFRIGSRIASGDRSLLGTDRSAGMRKSKTGGKFKV